MDAKPPYTRTQPGNQWRCAARSAIASVSCSASERNYIPTGGARPSSEQVEDTALLLAGDVEQANAGFGEGLIA